MTPVGCEIIVVDDDVSMALAIARLLSAAGWVVRTYGAAEEVLGDVHLARVGMLVLDIQLPGMSGLEFFRKLRAKGIAPPAIFITAQDREDMRDQAVEMGAVAFFTKPFEGSELIQVIRRHLKAA
jgi:FixJ family two-component response regulator